MRPFFVILIIVLVCGLIAVGHSLFSALGAVAVIMIVATDLACRLPRPQVEQ